MNPVKILEILFIMIDAIHDSSIAEWCNFMNNLEVSLTGLSEAEKIELVDKLHSLNLALGSRMWYRRLNLCYKLHELI